MLLLMVILMIQPLLVLLFLVIVASLVAYLVFLLYKQAGPGFIGVAVVVVVDGSEDDVPGAVKVLNYYMRLCSFRRCCSS